MWPPQSGIKLSFFQLLVSSFFWLQQLLCLVLRHNYSFTAILTSRACCGRPSFPLFFCLICFFFFPAGPSLIIHRKTLGNLSAICSCWVPVLVFFFAEKSSDEGLCSLKCNSAAALWQPTRHYGGAPPPPPVHPVRNAVLKCRSETACSPVSLTLLDAVCSYLCLITISMFYSVCLHSSRQMLNYSERAECKRWQRRQQETYSSFCFSSWKKTLSKLFDGQQQVWGEKGGQTQKKSVRLKDKIIKVIFFFHGIDLILLKLLQVSLYKSFIKSVKT